MLFGGIQLDFKSVNINEECKQFINRALKDKGKHTNYKLSNITEYDIDVF